MARVPIAAKDIRSVFMNWKCERSSTHLVPCADFEVDILSNRCRRPIRARLVPPLLSKLGPMLPFCNGVVDKRLLQHSLDFARNLASDRGLQHWSGILTGNIGTHLDFLTLIVYHVFHCCPDSVLINIVLSLL